MRKLLLTLLLALTPAFAQQPPKIAIIGLVHAHVWGHLRQILKDNKVQLVGIAEPNPALVAEAKKMGAADSLFTPITGRCSRIRNRTSCGRSSKTTGISKSHRRARRSESN